MKNKKILLIAPKCKAMMGEGWDIPGHPHLGLSYIASFLKQNHYEVTAFDVGVEGDYEKLRVLINSGDFLLIGITSYSYSYLYLIELIKEIIDVANCPIVVGGPHVTSARKEILVSTKVNFAVKGEGEHTLLELAEKIYRDETDFSDVLGLIWRGKGGVVMENMDRPYFQDVDSLPFPDFEVFNMEAYPSYADKSIAIMTERGCPYPCNFCAVRKTGFRPRSPQNVINEILHWYNKGFRQFDFNDDCFNLNRERAIEICNLIIENKLDIKYSLYNGIRADRVTYEMIKKFKESGCTFLSYGLETGNADTLKRIDKRVTLEQVKQASVWTKEIGIKHAINFIIGHPGETYETAMDSIRFAKELAPTVDYVNFYNLVPYPNTGLFEWVEKNGTFLVPKETYLLDISYRDNEPIFETPEFSAAERRKVVRAGFELFNKSILEFRLGKGLGWFGSFFMKSNTLLVLGRNIAFNTRLGRWLYIRMSKASRE